MKNNIKHIIVILFPSVLLLTAISIAYAHAPRVYAVLFFSPTCSHCHKVMTEDLPPLQEKYGEQLQVYAVDVSSQEGQALFDTTIVRYQIPDERLGVPMLVVGDTILVGSREIPQQFPSMIDSGLAGSGIDLPDIPGLDVAQLTLLVKAPTSADDETPEPLSTISPVVQESLQQEASNRPPFIQKFFQDPAGNSLAVILLVGMVICIIWAVWSFLSKSHIENTSWSQWAVPILALAGLFVAGYMTYIETTHTQAICGPIGNCNAVQQSPYAYVLGIIPVGVLGLVGYISILVTWILYRKGSARLQSFAAILCWGLIWFGVIFSLYLTFLEAFVIGATCAWCITSAMIMTVMLVATTGPVINAWNPED
jgi:uncharacterized membrane protein/thiol-disulfide isomerase/thioredoxin